MSGAVLHADGTASLPLAGRGQPLYVAYHDDEWGVPEYDDRALYEKLVLDGFQAGLSWITILRKRDNFRRAFDGFEPEKIARYDARKKAKLMQDAGIVRNRLKIEGAVLSARAYLEVMEKGPGFSALLWDFVDGKPKVNQFRDTKQVPAETALSQKMSKELAGARLQVRRPDHRLCLHAGGRHGQRPSGEMPPARGLLQSARQAQVASHRHAEQDDTPPRPARKAAAKQDARAWQRMLSGRRLDLLDPSPLDVEIEDIAHGLARVARWNGQTEGAHIFSVAQHTLLVDAVARARWPRLDRKRAARDPAARRAGIRHRRHDLAVQGGDRRRLQGRRGAAARRHPPALRAAGEAHRRDRAHDQDRRPRRGLSRGDAARGLRRGRGAALLRAAAASFRPRSSATI